MAHIALLQKAGNLYQSPFQNGTFKVSGFRA